MVRNFWIEAEIDGRKTTLAGGPRSKDGGFSLTVFQRDAGGIRRALLVAGYACQDGTLILSAERPAGRNSYTGPEVFRFESGR